MTKIMDARGAGLSALNIPITGPSVGDSAGVHLHEYRLPRGICSRQTRVSSQPSVQYPLFQEEKIRAEYS